jgi:hypothetical protein
MPGDAINISLHDCHLEAGEGHASPQCLGFVGALERANLQ